MATSAEVLQELLTRLFACLSMEGQKLWIRRNVVWFLDTVVSRFGHWNEMMSTLAWQLRVERFTSLSARDLCHLASCRRRDVSDMMTFDQGAARTRSGALA